MFKDREEIWDDMYKKYDEKIGAGGDADYRGFAELFEEKGIKGYDKGEKQFGSPDKSKKKLLNYSYPEAPESKLDLHGENTLETPLLVERYVRESREIGKTFVIIVCGVGRGSPDGKSKLRPVVVRKLLELQAEHRLKDFRTAEPKDGGLGAVYVYLR